MTSLFAFAAMGLAEFRAAQNRATAAYGLRRFEACTAIAGFPQSGRTSPRRPHVRDLGASSARQGQGDEISRKTEAYLVFGKQGRVCIFATPIRKRTVTEIHKTSLNCLLVR